MFSFGAPSSLPSRQGGLFGLPSLPTLPAFGQGQAPPPIDPRQVSAPPSAPTPPRPPTFGPPQGAQGSVLGDLASYSLTGMMGPSLSQAGPAASLLAPWLGQQVRSALPALPTFPAAIPQPANAPAPAVSAPSTGGPKVQAAPDASVTVGTGGASGIDNSSPRAFTQSLAGVAQQVSAQTGIPANILLAIAANETGWGTAMGGNNLMGIKGSGPSGSFTSPTWEVVNGQAVDTSDSFRAYGSAYQSMADFASFLQQNPRYAGALQYLQQTGDGSGFIQRVNQAGYATDPQWSAKIISIANDTIPLLLGA